MPREEQLAVLFGDVSGSTQLYDTLGDARARTIIARCMAVMTEATHRHGGTLIKTIGDEVMTTFASAAAAAEAACEMQEAITGQMVVDGRPLAIRVGFHFGPTLLEEADVFGDAVNLAARMTSQAKAGQILTTGETADRLTGARRKACRQIDLTQVRGKREEIAIHELLWQAEDATVMHAPWAAHRHAGGALVFTAGATRLEVGASHPSLTIGRAEQNDLVVRQPVVSRLHARIEYRNGRFMLTDLSANGTYVAPDDGSAGYVHRDSLELKGAGTLGLGEAVAAGSQVTVRYAPE
ncbi:MAG TPA: adenylate/guanylate cyclase domain-containing protein [Acetobacteraceae bacterium]|nr:adenylate/guanylate cyclase domain-containing protein [Acetobacteraceae bacterium]